MSNQDDPHHFPDMTINADVRAAAAKKGDGYQTPGDVGKTPILKMPTSGADKVLEEAINRATLTAAGMSIGQAHKAMDAFHGHPEIVQAHKDAEQMGVDPVKTVGLAVSKNPGLQKLVSDIHDQVNGLREKVGDALEAAAKLPKKDGGEARKSMEAGTAKLNEKSKDVPAAGSKTRLSDVISAILEKIRERIAGPRQAVAARQQQTGQVHPMRPRKP